MSRMLNVRRNADDADFVFVMQLIVNVTAAGIYKGVKTTATPEGSPASFLLRVRIEE